MSPNYYIPPRKNFCERLFGRENAVLEQELRSETYQTILRAFFTRALKVELAEIERNTGKKPELDRDTLVSLGKDLLLERESEYFHHHFYPKSRFDAELVWEMILGDARPGKRKFEHEEDKRLRTLIRQMRVNLRGEHRRIDAVLQHYTAPFRDSSPKITEDPDTGAWQARSDHGETVSKDRSR